MRIFALVVTTVAIFGTVTLINGCDEGKQMAWPVIANDSEPPIKELGTSEDLENLAIIIGDMKKPEIMEKSRQFASLKITRVRWYKDRHAKYPITADALHTCLKPYVYAKVVFSKPVKHVTGANNNNARPALFIVADDKETHLEILPNDSGGEKFPPNTSKKVQGIRGTTYLCRYELPTDIKGSSTIALRIGKNTVDIAGNSIGNQLYPAPFTITGTPQTVKVLGRAFIPPAKTTLSKNEKDLTDFFTLTGRNPIEPSLQKGAHRSVNRISLLPLKDREEVYDALVTAVDLPFFAEAAEKMKSRNVGFASLFVESVKTKNWEKFNNFLKNMDQEMGIQSGEVNENTLARIYFEENPEYRPNSKECSCYWMLLEYYRLRLQFPDLDLSVAWDKKRFLCLYRQSARAGNILGLANPWN